jgi:glutamine amidotransferase
MAQKSVVVVDYGMGNVLSVCRAFENQGANVALTGQAGEIAGAERLILPGVGAFGDCMKALEQRELIEPILDFVRSGRPFLGICVGMQMLFDASEEAPGVKGLGIFAGEVRRLQTTERLPHMGWNTITIRHGSILFDGIGDGSWLYFVHSYAPVPEDDGVIAATTDYGGPVVAAVEQGHVWATQFHPEKSADNGLRLLANFARVCTP